MARKDLQKKSNRMEEARLFYSKQYFPIRCHGIEDELSEKIVDIVEREETDSLH